MPPESMAQSIYDIGGAPFFGNDGDDTATLDDFLLIAQDANPSNTPTLNRAAVPVAAWYVEGYTKRLRRELTAWVNLVFQIIVGSPGGAEAGGIVVDPVALLAKANGIGGGINGGQHCLVGGAGVIVNGAHVVGAAWQVVHGGSSALSLVDHTGAEITTQLAANDQVYGSVQFLAVND